MSTRQERAPRRNNKLSNLKGRQQINNWSVVPDYERLPAWALLDLSEVSVVTGMSRTAIEKRISEGSFPAARKHGQNRVWPLGEVRQWCIAVGEAS